MNCANHVDVPAVAFCRTCGKPLCSSCARDVRGVIYCEECLASQLERRHAATRHCRRAAGCSTGNRRAQSAPGRLLGFIPGVGAMYNGEYAKGFVHVLIFATLIWMAAHVNGIFGLGIAAFVIYMPIEAYQTARARRWVCRRPIRSALTTCSRRRARAECGSRCGCRRRPLTANAIAAARRDSLRMPNAVRRRECRWERSS